MVNASPRRHAAAARPDGATAPRRLAGARRLGLAGAALLGLGACSYLPLAPSIPGAGLFESPRQFRGHMVDDEDLRQITVGVSSRTDVEALLGSPSATGTFDDADWFYIGGITRQRPARSLAVEDQQVVQIRFAGNGTVQEIRRLGPEDGRQVQAVARVTPSPGNERTLLQQLFGNIGRLGPGLGGQQTVPGPGGANLPAAAR